MNAKKFSEAMGELDSKYVEEAIHYKKKSKKSVWVKLGAAAVCVGLACGFAIHFISIQGDGDQVTNHTDTVSDNQDEASYNADVAPMIYVNGVLYKGSAEQISIRDLKDELVYLGKIQSDIINLQGAAGTETLLDGVPKENFQANIPIVGAKVYRYGDKNLVVETDGAYWLYEAVDDEILDNENGISIEKEMQIDPDHKSFLPL